MSCLLRLVQDKDEVMFSSCVLFTWFLSKISVKEVIMFAFFFACLVHTNDYMILASRQVCLVHVSRLGLANHEIFVSDFRVERLDVFWQHISCLWLAISEDLVACRYWWMLYLSTNRWILCQGTNGWVLCLVTDGWVLCLGTDGWFCLCTGHLCADIWWKAELMNCKFFLGTCHTWKCMGW